MTKPEIFIPTLLILLVVSVCAYVTYFRPQGPWYVVVYPDSTVSAFANATHFSDAVIETSATTTAHIPDAKNALTLQQSGALLIDPKGVELCSKK